MKKMNNRIGERKMNNQNLWMEIIEYNDYSNIVVRFDNTKSIKHTKYSHFEKGLVKDNFHPSVYGVGYLGNAKINDEFKNKKYSYKKWNSMIRRCYDENFIKRRPLYKDCIVDDRWLCYEHFEKDFDIMIENCKFENPVLDKDILNKYNKIYSKETCILIDDRINNLFIRKNANRGNLPIGVSKYKGKYRSNISKDMNTIFIGDYDCIEEAFLAYKYEKEKYIKEIAENYLSKNLIDNKIYNAMCNWKVEIND